MGHRVVQGTIGRSFWMLRVLPGGYFLKEKKKKRKHHRNLKVSVTPSP